MSGKAPRNSYYCPTVELIHNETVKKIDKIEDLTVKIRAKLQELNTDLAREYRFNLLVHNIGQVRKSYNLNVAQILVEYYKSGGKESDRCYEEYRRVVNMENFNSQIESHLHSIEKVTIALTSILEDPMALKKYAITAPKVIQIRAIIDEINRALDNIRGINITIEVKYENAELCSCGGKFIAVTGEIDLYCPDCSATEQNSATLPLGTNEMPGNNSGNGGAEGRRKYDNHKPNKHLKKCINIILAKKVKKINEEHLKRIEYVIKRDNYNLAEMDCEDMREVLQQLGLTTYNDYVPLLLKKCTGRGPPEFTFEELRVIIIKFNKIIELLPRVSESMGNISFYSYFIYKIVEKEFINQPDKLRLLDYIHLQARETVDKNDELLQKIAEIATPEDGLDFLPTDITRPYKRKIVYR